jgi:uncharacterized protein YndB with AHSA1/START domain
MSTHANYTPGSAFGADVHKDGDNWTLIVVRELRHAPEHVWQAITDPEHLHQWAPFDVDGSLATEGATVHLARAGAPTQHISPTTVKRADPPRLLEYNWGLQKLRWQLEPTANGTRLTLWHSIDHRFICWGAAGWHICFDVLDRLLAGAPIGRIVGAPATNAGWQRLVGEYAQQFGLEAPSWSLKAAQKS